MAKTQKNKATSYHLGRCDFHVVGAGPILTPSADRTTEGEAGQVEARATHAFDQWRRWRRWAHRPGSHSRHGRSRITGSPAGFDVARTGVASVWVPRGSFVLAIARSRLMPSQWLHRLSQRGQIYVDESPDGTALGRYPPFRPRQSTPSPTLERRLMRMISGGLRVHHGPC